jgi:hypothetical protein
MSEDHDGAVLKALLEGAEKLCGTGDALLAGQYEYLRERIRAIIELRAALGGE